MSQTSSSSSTTSSETQRFIDFFLPGSTTTTTTSPRSFMMDNQLINLSNHHHNDNNNINITNNNTNNNTNTNTNSYYSTHESNSTSSKSNYHSTNHTNNRENTNMKRTSSTESLCSLSSNNSSGSSTRSNASSTGIVGSMIQKEGEFSILHTIVRTKNSIVARAKSLLDKRTVVVKYHADERPLEKSYEKYVREYEVGKQLFSSEYVVEYYQMKKMGHALAIVMEDFGAEGLSGYIPRGVGLAVDEFLSIAIQMARGLSDIHQQNIIHGALTSANILFNSTTKQIKYSGFGHASQLKTEHQYGVMNFSSMRSNLAYMAPEQTGRMNRDVDNRSDLYSLGVVLYEMLSGDLPFWSPDPLDLIYSQVAIKPKELHSLLPHKVPLVLSNIISRLLEKNSDERYQSSVGLERDLQYCLDMWKQHGDIIPDHGFKIALHDRSNSLHISQKLYGREVETQRLLSMYDKVCTGQEPNLIVLVRGYSGIGKTRLIHSVHKPMTKHRGYFISGKFDQFKKNIPYASFIQAFQQVIGQVLSEPEARIEYWKKELLEALNNKGQVIIDVIPQVEHIIGPQPSVPVLSSSDNENRFHLVFQKFIRVFANSKHPLVLMLDDLQWADSASLRLIEVFMSDPNNQFLLLIGAYRDNEVSEEHPLMKMLEEVGRKTHIEDIELGPLSLENTSQLVADTFFRTLQESKALSELVHNRTGGNPFYAIQTITRLVADKRILFNFPKSRWEWDMNEVKKSELGDNIVEMMTHRIKNLPTTSQKMLSMAASIGNIFSLRMLALVCELNLIDTYSILWHAIQDELLIQLGSEYKWNWSENEFTYITNQNVEFKFLHDRVQQAAYELIEPNELSVTHLKIARLMFNHSPVSDIEENLFDILGHYRLAVDLITDVDERLTIAQMCSKAGKKAKDSAAYSVSVGFLLFGIKLLPDSAWEEHYDLMFTLHKMLVECEYLRRDYEEAERLYVFIPEKAKTNLDKIEIYNIQANQYEAQYRYDDCLRVLQNSLSLLGIQLPTEESDLENFRIRETEEINMYLRTHKIADLVHQPEITDPSAIAIINILACMWSPSYSCGRQRLMKCVSVMMANFCIKNGRCDVSSVAYTCYSFIAGIHYSDFKTGHEFGLIGVELCELYDNLRSRTQSYLIYGCSAVFWTRPIRQAVHYMEKCFETCLDAGNLATIGHAAHYIVSDYFFAGEQLHKCKKIHDRYFSYLKRTNMWMYTFGCCATTALRYLLGDDSYNENEEIKNFSSEVVVMGGYYSGKLMKIYWSRERTGAVEMADKAREHVVHYLFGTYKHVIAFFYSSLIYLWCMDDFSEEEKPLRMAQVLEMLSSLKLWASHCECNFMHKVHIIEAEIARCKKDLMLATELFEKAITSANKHGFLQYEGLANELCAEMLYVNGRDRYASCHIKDALYIYKRYGAQTKVRKIVQEHPWLIQDISDLGDEDLKDTSQLDLITLLRASTALSKELHLEGLMSEMMKLLLKNSGAYRVIFVLLQQDEKLLVVAEGSNDDPHDTIRAVPLESWSSNSIPKSIINFISRTQKSVLLDDCSIDNPYCSDPFWRESQVRSVLALPVVKQTVFKGVLYLESNLANAFNSSQIQFLNVLTSQITILLENAKFSALLESEKRYRSIAHELEVVKKRLEEFIDVLCHELRNPLNGLYGSKSCMADVLSQLNKFLDENDYLIDNESKRQFLKNSLKEFQEFLAAFSVSSEHLFDIVNTVLTLSVLENSQTVLQSIPFSVNDTLNQVLLMFKAKIAAKHLSFVLELPDEDYLVVGDPYRFKEVVINLLSNAVKFTDKGHIAIRYYCTACTDTDVTLAFNIEDSGIGLDETEQSRLFKAFSQANSQTYSRYGGTGLGLKISADLLELMGGSIELNSEKDKGTTFSFAVKFKRAPNDTEAALEENSTSLHEEESTTLAETIPSDSRKKLHILIAEDNSINAKLLKRIIDNSGYTCHVSHNGQEALDYYLAGNSVDVVLMDLEMPIMGGFEATQAIRREEQQRGITESVVIIGVSANARSEIVTSALSHGMQGFVTKPYHAKDILSVIALHSRRKESVQ